MKTLLLIEDDRLLGLTLKENLELEGYVVIEAISGSRSVDIISYHPVHLILLDLRLPDGSGLDFISKIRRHTDVPLIVISGLTDKKSIIQSLDLGADDFVSKPVDIDELIARINANLRRYSPQGAKFLNAGQSVNDDIIVFGQWTFDRNKYQIFDNENQSGNLTTQEFKLLDFLIKNEGHAMKRIDLCEAIKEDNYVPTARSIDVKITRIRKKIGDDADDPQIIKTIRGIGYMFNRRI